MSNKQVVPEAFPSLMCSIPFHDVFLRVFKSEVSKMCSMELSTWAGGKQSDAQYFSSLILDVVFDYQSLLPGTVFAAGIQDEIGTAFKMNAIKSLKIPNR